MTALEVLLERRLPQSPIEGALSQAVRADRLGEAFRAGYQAALAALFPGEAARGPASLLVTEVSGNSPRAIATTVGPEGLRGDKTFVTDVERARTLYVLASAGATGDGKKDLRVARVAADAPGVRFDPLPPTPFCPEIGHARVRLEVLADAVTILPGDGWVDHVKPFRTVEDIHVTAAAVAYVFGVARRGRVAALLPALAALAEALAGLAAAPASSPLTHVRLAGVLDLLRGVDLGAAFAGAPDDERARWERDRPLLGIAGKARAERTAIALAALAGAGAGAEAPSPTS